MSSQCKKQVKQDKHHYARTIQFWFRHTKNRPKYFVLKNKLSNEEIVTEHIAHRMYGLIGVKVPNCYIVKQQDGEYALVSEYLHGYSDVLDLIGGEEILEKLDKLKSVDERVKFFSENLTKKKLSFSGKEHLLVGSVFLTDHDVLGAGLTNIGGIPSCKNTIQLVNIDPGEASILSNATFGEDISLEHRLLNRIYEAPLVNGPSILGNMHYLEFFSDVSKANIIKAIQDLIAIPDEEIKRHFLREEYYELVSAEFIQLIVYNLIERKQFFSTLLKAYPTPEYRQQPIDQIFIDGLNFSEPLKKIDRGAHRPNIVKYLEQESEVPVDEPVSKNYI